MSHFQSKSPTEHGRSLVIMCVAALSVIAIVLAGVASVHAGGLFQLAALAVVPILAILVSTALILSTTRLRLSGFVLSIVGLVLIIRSPGCGISSSTSPAAYLKFVSFNTGTVPTEGVRLAAGQFARMADETSPSALCLQQAKVRLQDSGRIGFPPFLEQSGVDSQYVTVLPSDPEHGRVFQPVLADFQLVGQSETVLRFQPVDREAMRITRTVGIWRDRQLAIYNLHLRTFGSNKPWRDEDNCLLSPSCWAKYFKQYYRSFEIRAWEAREVKKALDAEELPFIVCGDFNATPDQWVYHHIADGLQDAWRVAGKGWWGATFPRSFPLARIDYILASEHWDVLEAEVVDVGFSDHRAVVAKLALKE